MLRSPSSLALALVFLAGPALGAAPEHLEPDQPETAAFRSSYRAITPAQAQNTTVIFAPGGPALPVYLNRHGGTFFAGWDDSATNTSSIVENGSATVGDFPGSDTQWAQVLTCVQEQFAAFNVVVTDQEPASGNYIEAVIGGSPGQLGMPNNVGGVAPIDPYNCNLLDKAVVYAFADNYLQGGWGGTQALCETATQEIAHAMSLDHALLCEDPMTYLSGCGDKWFQDQWASCGEYQARDCICDRPSQNSVAILLEILGPSDGSPPPPPVMDEEAPVVSLVSPDDDEVFVANTQIDLVAQVSDDVALTQVQLYWENNDLWLNCPGQGGGWACTRSGDTYTWSLAPTVGARSYFVRARDGAGNTTDSQERTVWLTEDGSPPPEDNMPPEVAIASPLDGAELQANSTISVVVTASDDAGIAQVRLAWDYSNDEWGCPLNTQTVQCAVDGSTYTWTILVGEGTRTFRAAARDVVGNEVVTADRTITLVGAPTQGPENDAFEDDDTWDQGAAVACGDTLTRQAVAGDDDWFRLQVPSGQGARFGLGGEVGASLELHVQTGPFSGSVLADGVGVEIVEVVPEVADLGVRVVAPPGVSGAYTLDVDCLPAEDLDPPSPPGDGDGDGTGGDGDGTGGDGDGTGGDGDGLGGDGDDVTGPGPIVGCSAAHASSSSALAAAPGLLGLAGLALLGAGRRRRLR